MIKKALILMSLTTCFLMANQLDGKKFKEKLSKPLPQWMQDQIREDLAPYKERGVNKEALDRTFEEITTMPGGYNSQLIRYEIKNNRMSITSKHKYKGDARVEHLIDFIHTMAKYVKMPDVDIIASLWDCFDNPTFLEHCYCPVFTICKQKQNHTAVLWPETVYIGFKTGVLKAVYEASEKSPWKKKKDKVYWRGNSTNGFYAPHNWDKKMRPRLVMFSMEHPELIDAKLTGTYWTDKHVAKWIEGNDFIADWIYPPGQVEFKYHIAIDGNSFPSSFYWQLISNCVIMKSRSSHLEWFYRGLKDGVHYVSFDPDCHDLLGVIRGLQRDQDYAQKIAKAATKFAKETLMMEDIACYFYHLFTEYSKLQQF